MTLTNAGEPDAPARRLNGRQLAASLTVKDLERSSTWYQNVLGFTVAQRHERGGKAVAVSLSAGEVKILLTQDDGSKGWDRDKGDGFSLMITTDQDVDAIAAHAKALGATLDSEPADTPWGARVFRLRDPDGFKYAITSERSRPPA
jgi:uncharacterized glyoxalase superfamily protein PhnB